MTIELQMLVYTALLSVVLAFPPLIAAIQSGGFAYAGGNRDEGLELPVWGQRAVRAQLNMLANLPAFAALVLVAAVAGISNEQTQFGAQLFFWARLAHALIYLAGIPWLRAIAFIASFSGMMDIVRALLAA
jgi:uncharacterized MAPEG superfamily protein